MPCRPRTCSQGNLGAVIIAVLFLGSARNCGADLSYRLPADALRVAIRHLCRYGDTDLFPHLPELAFFHEKEAQVVSDLAQLDLDTYNPAGAIEALAPKNRLSFRIAHQLSAVDSLLFLGCVVAIGARIEARRAPPDAPASFSYRFNPQEDGQLFRPDRTFRNWLITQREHLAHNSKVATIILTDISDFYARANFHRLENLLDQIAPGDGAARFIKKQIKGIRAKQSFGLPIGGSASRLLAELVLADTDLALVNQGIFATRFVDDFRLFLSANEDAYDALGFLAEQLGINEGLSLNAGKTFVLERGAYLDTLERLTTDVSEQAEGVALESLTAELYFDEDPDPNEINRLKSLNLLGLLNEELKREPWDVARIRMLFRALKITRSKTAIEYIVDHFRDLVVFAKELCLLMDTLQSDTPKCFDGLLDSVIEAILRPPASSVHLIRTWLLEIFVRRIIEIPPTKLKRLEGLSFPLDKRQLLLIRGGVDDQNFFRRQKTAFDNFSTFEQPCLVWGASCLPGDEYQNWLTSIRPAYWRPIGSLFLDWAKENKGKLIARLSAQRDEHPH
jgi:hypothetical protein